MIVTTSEFGRRYFENGSTGTDHGTAAPTMVFGNHLVPDLFGEQPSLSSLDQNNNLFIQHDFRQLYSSIITDWFGLDQNIANTVFGQEFESIPFIQTPLSIKQTPIPANFTMEPAFPNPFNPTTILSYTLPKNGNVTIRILDLRGRKIKTFRLGIKNAGKNKFILNGTQLASGTYIIQIDAIGSLLNQKITLLK